MNDPVDRGMALDQGGDRRPVGDVGALEDEAGLSSSWARRARFRDVVIIVEIVDRDTSSPASGSAWLIGSR